MRPLLNHCQHAVHLLLIYALDLLFILLAAKTWRREEVMAQRWQKGTTRPARSCGPGGKLIKG